MRAIYALPGVVMALALFGAGASMASAADDTSGKCSTTVDRSGAAGSFSVSQQTLDSGSCVCYVTTGPSPESDAIEKKVGYVQASGKCGEHDEWPVYLLSAGAGIGGIVAAFSDSGGNDSAGG
jgi:hypothetical protein